MNKREFSDLSKKEKAILFLLYAHERVYSENEGVCENVLFKAVEKFNIEEMEDIDIEKLRVEISTSHEKCIEIVHYCFSNVTCED